MRKLESQIILSLGKSPKSVWELLEENKFPLKDFIATANSLYTEGLISCKDEKIILTEKGKERLNKEELELESRICDKCKGKMVLFNGKFKMALEEFKKISEKRPLPDLNYFQGYMREDNVFSRIALMHHYGDLYRKDFILIGDDDLLSVALSLTKLPSRILVLDIDGRLSTFLKEVNRKYGFNIEFLKYDVKDPLPQELVGKFDVFSSEPLESLSGLKAFVLRGIVSLKKEGVGYFGLTTCEASPHKWLSVEKMVTNLGCRITDLIRDFSIYPTSYGSINYENFVDKFNFPVKENPGVCWYKSSLFRIELLKTPPLRINKELKIKPFDPLDDVTYPHNV